MVDNQCLKCILITKRFVKRAKIFMKGKMITPAFGQENHEKFPIRPLAHSIWIEVGPANGCIDGSQSLSRSSSEVWHFAATTKQLSKEAHVAFNNSLL